MEKSLDSASFICRVCERKTRSVKRCVNCRRAYYCSRQCQMKDWPSHRSSCQLCIPQTTDTEMDPTFSKATDLDNCVSNSERAVHSSIVYATNRHKILAEANISVGKVVCDSETKPSVGSVGSVKQTDHIYTQRNASDNEGDVIYPSANEEPSTNAGEFLDENRNLIKIKDLNHRHMPCLLQQTKHDKVKDVSPRSNSSAEETKAQTEEHFLVTVRSGSGSFLIHLNRSWSSEEMLRKILSTVKIIPEKLRLISCGKQITVENLLWAVSRSKPVFLAIGEKAENEDGLDAGDISVVMQQLAVDRNVAVRALRQTDDVVDAILLIGNK